VFGVTLFYGNFSVILAVIVAGVTVLAFLIAVDPGVPI
jgi:hypothetical protein